MQNVNPKRRLAGSAGLLAVAAALLAVVSATPARASEPDAAMHGDESSPNCNSTNRGNICFSMDVCVGTPVYPLAKTCTTTNLHYPA